MERLIRRSAAEKVGHFFCGQDNRPFWGRTNVPNLIGVRSSAQIACLVARAVYKPTANQSSALSIGPRRPRPVCSTSCAL